MVYDVVTGLIWEVKQDKDDTQNYSNPNDADNTYTWYDSNPETNGGDAGTPGTGTDTEDFINALNSGEGCREGYDRGNLEGLGDTERRCPVGFLQQLPDLAALRISRGKDHLVPHLGPAPAQCAPDASCSYHSDLHDIRISLCRSGAPPRHPVGFPRRSGESGELT